MRVIHLVANLDVGGLERQVIDLAVQQRRFKHESSIYCLFHEGELAPQARRSGVPVVAFGKPRGLSLLTIRRLIRKLQADRPDVLHTHNAVVHHYGIVAAKWCRIPRVMNTQHGTGTLTHDPRLARIFAFTMPWTDAVVMVSEEVRTCLVQRIGIPARKTHVIRNGIPLQAFEGFRAKPGSQLPKIRFGTVGRLATVKDHRTLIQAFREVSNEFPFAELHIAGEGPLRAEIEQQILAAGLSQSVCLHGMRNDIGGFLSDLDIFVLSSLSEGLPIAVLEALAVGLPVVSTNVGGIAEVCGMDGTEYCEPSQPAALAQAMLRMARRCDLSTLGAQARIRAINHGIEATWSQYLALFEPLSGASHS